MTTRIDHALARLRRQREKGFIAYITAGDPSPRETVDIVLALERVGVDMVELGIPFSDPLADGKVNQLSAARALAAGTTLARVWECIRSIRRRSEIPLLCYSYVNPLLAGGYERNIRAAARAGLDGLLVLDLPVEEAAESAALLREYHLNNVCLVTPTTPEERIRRIVKMSTGFIYAVSREGVTGMQKRLSAGADAMIRLIQKHTRLPVALGFGVSSPAQAQAAVRSADAVVVGSAVVDRFYHEARSAHGRHRAARWVKNMVDAVKEV
jgi:tryptophan synthase alpha chain